MNANRDRLVARLWPRLSRLRQRLQRDMAGGGLASLAALNLTVPQAMALFRLAEGGPRTISELQRATGRSQAATSHLVTSLEKKQLVARLADAEDARRTLVHITPKALALVAQTETLRLKTFETTLRAVPTALVKRLDDAMADVLEALGEER